MSLPKIAVALAVLALAASSAAAQDAKLVTKGEQVYTANKCSLCHSIGDTGNKKGPLDGVGSKLSADQVREWLLHPADMTAKTKGTRKPAMKSYEKLPKDDLDALVAYMMSLKKK